MIRVFFAELEEKLANLAGAKKILMSYFESYRSSISFVLVVPTENALEVLPDFAMFRVFFAELEEKLDNLACAKNILMSYFEAFPSAISFDIVERFLWRTAGKIAARKFFSNTLRLRKSNKLSYHVYITHGLLELQANREPEVALRVFELACSNNPESKADPTFVTAYGRVDRKGGV